MDEAAEEIPGRARGAHRTWAFGLWEAASRKSWKKFQQGSDLAGLWGAWQSGRMAGRPCSEMAMGAGWPGGRGDGQGTGGDKGQERERLLGSSTHFGFLRCKTQPSPGCSFAAPPHPTEPLPHPRPPSHSQAHPLHTASAVHIQVGPSAFLAFTLLLYQMNFLSLR